MQRVESLPGYERTFPPHWRDAVLINRDAVCTSIVWQHRMMVDTLTP